MTLLRPRAVSFASDRSWSFEQSPEELWERLTDFADYPSWWPWLRRFRPIGGFEPGARWSCTVAPPVPYDVSFTVLLEQVEPMRSVRAKVGGDIEGDALLSLEPDGGGCSARLTSSLAPASRLLRSVGAAARPLVEWSHDWVLDQGQRQFVESALQDD